MKARRTVLITAVVAAFAVIAVVAGPGSAGTTLSPIPTTQVEKIAYFEYMEHKDITCFDIFFVNPDGSGKSNLSHDDTAKTDVAPNWSPDGNWLAFARYDGVGTHNYADVLLARPDSNRVKFLSGPSMKGVENTHPTWSPDGKTVVFSSNRDGNFDLYAADVDQPDAKPVQLTWTNAPVQNLEPDWAPFGQTIVFTRTGHRIPPTTAIPTPGAELFVLSTTGPTARRLTTSKTTIGDRHAAFSPDGKQIAYSSDRFGDQDLWVINANGRNNRLLAQGKMADIEPSWSPDGNSIVFLSTRTGATELWRLDLMSAGPFPLVWPITNDGVDKGAPDWGRMTTFGPEPVSQR